MIDNLILASTHVLLLITAWRLVNSPALDDERATTESGRKQRWGNKADRPGA